MGRYLKYYCNATISWGRKGDGDNLHIPTPLPEVKETWKQEVTCVGEDKMQMLDDYRYFMNVCTFGYSYAFWDWERWEREIDWMALNGINLPLAFVGQERPLLSFNLVSQEYILGEVYKELGLSEEEILEHFTGIAFLV